MQSIITIDFFNLPVLFGSSMLMLIILYFGMKYIKKINFANPYVVYLIFFFSFYKVMAYYIFPLILGVYSNFKYLEEDNISLQEQGLLYFIEMLSWITWLLGLVTIASFFKNKASYISLKDNATNYFSKITLLFFSISYLPLSLLVQADPFGLELFSLPIWIEIFKSLIGYAGPPASLLLIILCMHGWSWRYAIVGALGTFSFLASLSSRGALVYSILFIFFLLSLTSKNQKYFLLNIVGAGSLIVLMFFFTGGLPSLSIDKDNSRIKFSIDKDKKGDRSAFEEIEWRFGAPSRMSVAFIRMYDRGDGAGFNPIVNSLGGFLPRSTNPYKPHPSTLDGSDFYSQGMYLIYREIYGYHTFSMVEFSSGAHAYWELGWIGVIVLPYVSGIYIALCAYFFQRLGIVSLVLMMAIFKPFGYVDPKIWVSDIAMQFYQIISPLILLLILYYVIKNNVKIFTSI